MKFNPTQVTIFINWMRERESIRKKREAGKPKPWTKDEILQQYRFCNVFREDDAVTKDIRRIFSKYEHTKHIWFLMCVARQINHTPTLEEIAPYLIPFQGSKVKKIMHAKKARGEKVYTSAYMLTNAAAKIPKIDYTVDLCLKPLWRQRARLERAFTDTYSLHAFWELLMKEKGFGPFITYEVVTDLRHTSHLKNAKDIHTWANAGPGALRGLNRLQGLDLKNRMNMPAANELMQQLLPIAQRRLKGFPQLEMRDIEHSLCEFDKYSRVLTGEGRPKQKFDGK